MLPVAVDEISYDHLDLLQESNDSKLRQLANTLIQKYEGFELEIYEGDIPMFTDKVWVQDLSKSEECILIITAQFMYIISINSNKLLFKPIKLT